MKMAIGGIPSYNVKNIMKVNAICENCGLDKVCLSVDTSSMEYSDMTICYDCLIILWQTLPLNETGRLE